MNPSREVAVHLKKKKKEGHFGKAAKRNKGK